MRIHLIAIGGKVMHNLALELQAQGHHVSGSDDEIYDPARGRLEEAGLLPEFIGWDSERITTDIDEIILGMHAHLDNPELIRAQELGISISSFPEYIGKAIQKKKSIVVSGSHGKSTTTAMIMHALQYNDIHSDYALGGMLKGFDRMVSLSDAPIAVIEGDEYLSSRLNPTPKMWHYHGNVIIITGIEWDHMNVFPSLENYIEQFEILIKQSVDEGATIIWYQEDEYLQKLMSSVPGPQSIPYKALEYQSGKINWEGSQYSINIFGRHNMANLSAGLQACRMIGIQPESYLDSMNSFNGVGKRLELIGKEPVTYLDYAHAPSKVRATVEAVSSKHSSDKILSVYELHTYSSLNKDFLPNYHNTLSKSDRAIVFYNSHALEMKRMPPLEKALVQEGFGGEVLVIDNRDELQNVLEATRKEYDVFLFMSSGTFDGLPIRDIFS